MGEQRPRPSVPDGGEPTLRALALRLLTSEAPRSAVAEQPRLFVGRLPENLPVEIPVPEGFVIVGSVVRGERVGEPAIEVVLDAALPAEQAHESYRELMASTGWRKKEWFKRRPGGFESGPPAALRSSATAPAGPR